MADDRLPLFKTSRVFGAFRWAFMPFGLLAVLALGVHAAADLVDDRLLWLLVGLDARLDGLLGAHEETRAFVDRVGLHECTVAARWLTLAWELAVDLALGVPLLGYSEKAAHELRPGGARDVLRRLNERPTPLRLLRPVMTLLFALGGAEAVARLVEGTVFVASSRELLAAGNAALLARVLGAAAGVLVVWRFAWPSAVRALEHADQATEASAVRKGRVWTLGLWGTAVSLPLAVAAALAVPLRSLFT